MPWHEYVHFHNYFCHQDGDRSIKFWDLCWWTIPTKAFHEVNANISFSWSSLMCFWSRPCRHLEPGGMRCPQFIVNVKKLPRQAPVWLWHTLRCPFGSPGTATWCRSTSLRITPCIRSSPQRSDGDFKDLSVPMIQNTENIMMLMTRICRHFKEDFEQAIVQLSEPLIDASLDLYKWERTLVINMMMMMLVLIVMMVVQW